MLVEGGLIIEGICKSQLQTCRIEIPDSILEGKNKEEQNNYISRRLAVEIMGALSIEYEIIG